MCSYIAKLCIASCVSIWLYNVTFSFVFLEQITSTTTITNTTADTNNTATVVTATGGIDNKPVPMPTNTTCSDSSKLSQIRDSTEHISLNPLTKGVQSTVPPKPKLKPKPKKLRPIANAGNKKIGCSVSPDSVSSAAGDMDKVDTCQNVSEQNLPVPHIPPASEQFLHSEESINVVGNFPSNYLMTVDFTIC